MSEDRPARTFRAEDLATFLPDLAARMRRVAHHPWNFMRSPRNIYGWNEPQAVDAMPDPSTPAAPTHVHRRCDGWVPADLLIARDRSDNAGCTFTGYEPDTRWFPVEDLEPYLLFRYRLVDTPGRVILTYTVDDGPPLDAPMRHLSVQVSAPGRLGQGDAANYSEHLLQMQQGLVGTFFPAALLGTPVRAGLRVGTPWEVKEASGNLRAIGWKTPVVMDFVMSHDLAPPEAPRRRVQLYGPGGEPV